MTQVGISDYMINHDYMLCSCCDFTCLCKNIICHKMLTFLLKRYFSSVLNMLQFLTNYRMQGCHDIAFVQAKRTSGTCELLKTLECYLFF